jgi:hypothetical protein
VAELKEMIRSSPPKGSPTSLKDRPHWNDRPYRNPPGNLRGVKPVTQEPWREVAESDLAARMDFGSRDALGLPDYEDAVNGLVVEASRQREAREDAVPWNGSVVRHEPPLLRGQKTVKRAEPWSEFHNDNIEELNAIDGSSVEEVYAITADRDNRVEPTVVQPTWDSSQTLGRRQRPGGSQETRERAEMFREQRRNGGPRAVRGGATSTGSPGGWFG